MKKLYLITVVLFLNFTLLLSQTGGNNIYQFLDTSPNARTTALSGMLIATEDDDDVGLSWQNPAILNANMQWKPQWSHQFYVADISQGYAAFSYNHFPKFNTVAGIKYINYGKFNGRDENNFDTGSFSGGEFALQLGASYQFKPKIRFGANYKFITSNFAGYKSAGNAFDFAALYSDTTKQFTASIVLHHLGFQFSKYNEERENLPFDARISVSKRLKHLPFRFSVVAHHLTRWNIRFDDPALQSSSIFVIDTNDIKTETFFIDKLFHHLNFSGEFYFGKSFNVRFGYAHLRKRELAYDERPWLSGISCGFGFDVKQFTLDYALALKTYPVATNHFTFGYRIR